MSAPAPRLARIGVLISGRGSNMEALAEGCERGDIPAKIVVVISHRAEAAGLERARARGLATAVIAPRDYADRSAFELELARRLQLHGVEWVCLAGFMRLLSREFLAEFPDRVVNIHPSLLPAFPGLDAQHQALVHGAKITGCTVHLVDSGLDSGPIVAQRAIEIDEDDTVESLSSRLLLAEHETYTRAMRLLLGEEWSTEGRRVRFRRGGEKDSESDC